MLFAIKRRWFPSVLLLVAFLVVGTAARRALGLPLEWPIRGESLAAGAAGFGALAFSDVLGHAILSFVGRDRYRARVQALVEYFRPQGPLEILCGGLLAAGEEVIFRGVLLEGLRHGAGAGVAVATTAAAVAFGLAHWLPDRRLAPFAVSAAWQGALLGCLYVVSGSLAAAMLAHAAHDAAGFAFFAWRRRPGKPSTHNG